MKKASTMKNGNGKVNHNFQSIKSTLYSTNESRGNSNSEQLVRRDNRFEDKTKPGKVISNNKNDSNFPSFGARYSMAMDSLKKGGNTRENTLTRSYCGKSLNVGERINDQPSSAFSQNRNVISNERKLGLGNKANIKTVDASKGDEMFDTEEVDSLCTVGLFENENSSFHGQNDIEESDICDSPFWKFAESKYTVNNTLKNSSQITDPRGTRKETDPLNIPCKMEIDHPSDKVPINGRGDDAECKKM